VVLKEMVAATPEAVLAVFGAVTAMKVLRIVLAATAAQARLTVCPSA
jgi:hypothetical protein